MSRQQQPISPGDAASKGTDSADNKLDPPSNKKPILDQSTKPKALTNVPARLIDRLTFEFKLKPGEAFTVKTNAALSISQLPQIEGIEQLDLGDIVSELYLKKDGPTSPMTSRRELYKLVKRIAEENKNNPYEIVVSVNRVIRFEPILPNSPLIPAAVDVQAGFSYLVGYMMLLPNGSLGLKIKSYNFKIYVTSTDNGFNCISKRTLFVGDAILSVDEKPVANIKECSQHILSALEKKGFVSVVIERPDSSMVAPLVRAALIAEKTLEMDPKMSDDVIMLCKEENERRRRHPDVKVKAILRKGPPTSRGIISFKATSMECPIDMDLINPILLRPVHRETNGRLSAETSAAGADAHPKRRKSNRRRP